MSPKVSILIPCYNAERWIAQAIQSALGQTYPHKEVIVIDDGSSDRSLDIIQSFGDAIVWATQTNQGGNVTRNHLLELSDGEWLQYLDADDYLLLDKIEKQVHLLDRYPEVDILYGPSIFEHWDTGQSYQELLPIPEPHDPYILLARWFLPQTGSPLWRKQAILDVGGWKPDQPCCQEHELYYRLLTSGKKFIYADAAGSVYRQWSNDTVCKKDMSQTWQMRLQIEDALEAYLSQSCQLTPHRQWAINQARFEIARMVWLVNKDWAYQIIRQIHNQDATFSPADQAAPGIYSLLYRCVGFRLSEYMALAKRRTSRFCNPTC
jgi:glycosyltransferase involved in cell wall biosynthesis